MLNISGVWPIRVIRNPCSLLRDYAIPELLRVVAGFSNLPTGFSLWPIASVSPKILRNQTVGRSNDVAKVAPFEIAGQRIPRDEKKESTSQPSPPFNKASRIGSSCPARLAADHTFAAMLNLFSFEPISQPWQSWPQ